MALSTFDLGDVKRRMQGAINDARYRTFDPALSALMRAAPSDKRIGLAFSTYWSLGDLSPIWPAFGMRLGNEVEFVGEFVDGFLTPYTGEAEFQRWHTGDRATLTFNNLGFLVRATPASN